MGFPRQSLFIFMPLLFLLSQLHLILTLHSPFMQPLYHHDERSALLQFKESFIIDRSASVYAFCQKVATWRVEGDESDCCSWDGVECDEGTGHVIGLDLSDSCLKGSINSSSSLFHLVHLQSLNLAFNDFNYSQIPSQVRDFSRLTHLNLSTSNFSGQIPLEISQLSHLSSLDLSDHCHMHFSPYPHLELRNPNLRSIVGNLTRLEKLDLSCVNISSTMPSILANLSSLMFLSLSGCGLYGEFPVGIFKLTNLTSLYLSRNAFVDNIPPSLGNLTKLVDLDLSSNAFVGNIPPSFGNLVQLSSLDLTSNLLRGSLPVPPISTQGFYISNNSLTGNVSELFCNLSSLQVLDLANNNLHGSLPRCLDNFGASLSRLDLQRNNFQGSFPETWTKGNHLRIINFSQNNFQGPLPRSLAKNTMLKVLDLSYNQFVDIFPSWLENLPNLEVLVLRSNKFQGNLWGSLEKITRLKVLDLGDNKFSDIFPFWLGHMSNLRVLILRSNKFNGPIGDFETYLNNIQILDISDNDFIGKLPLGLLENWKARKVENVYQLTYFDENSDFGMQKSLSSFYSTRAYSYSMMITIKGRNVFYEKVFSFFAIIDFSNNRFVGEISKSIENLSGFYLLNLSNNYLTGHIPLSLGNLIMLEALDLSHNNLLGEIPQQLTQLLFLESFNVSHNNLTGLIPQGLQFDTFGNTSFEGNLGLCGRPLTRKCENSNEPSQPSQRSPFEFGWKIVVIGYGFGFAVGVIIEQIVILWKRDWLMKTLQIRLLSGRRRINK